MAWVKKFRQLISEERGSWLLPVGLGLLGFLGQQQSAQAQNRATDIASQGAEANKAIMDYMLNKRRDVYDPIETGILLPALKKRAQTTAGWVPQAKHWGESLGAKMTFPTADKPRSEVT